MVASFNPKNLAIAIIFTASLVDHLTVEAVIVDGRRSGPSALTNQSHEEDMIDGYNTKSCGISEPDTKKSHFVNEAVEGQFPWLVSFQVKKKDGTFSHFCMGAFVSDRWILSAAHCFAPPLFRKLYGEGKVRVTAGSINAYNPVNANFTMERVFYHSQFDKKSPIGFDVALVQTKEKAQMRIKYDKKLPFINTVCLPKTGKEFTEGQAVKIAGWGDTESKDPKSKPDNLLTTDLLLTNGEQCAEIFSKKLKKVENQYHNYKDFICASYKGTRDACQGDSGAPLLEYADGKAVGVGIVSYGLGCATEGVPGIYSKTSSFMPWIKDITQYKEQATVQYIVLKPSRKS